MNAPPKCKRCQKLAWPTFGHADTARIRTWAKFRHPQRVYRCPHDNGWHLTSQNGSVKL